MALQNQQSGEPKPAASQVSPENYLRRYVGNSEIKAPDQRIIIEVVGIGFFDRLHGQRGMAPNGIKIIPYSV